VATFEVTGRRSAKRGGNHNKAACAVANKLARICYATLRDGEPYGTPSRLAHKLNRSEFAIAQ
jgi:hypothetical protein